jgi:hypothetical protein
MACDHYVSQTYLRNFTNPKGVIVPYYKNSQVIIGKPKAPKSICFETEGDTNEYFKNPRLLDELLPVFENPWKNNVDKLEKGFLDENTKCELAGYIAFLRSCNPTAKRLLRGTVAGLVKGPLNLIGRAVFLSDENKLSLLNEYRKIEKENNENRGFAHVIGIRDLIPVLYQYYCSHRLVLINETNIPFITSDNPAILYYQDIQQQYGLVYVPLKPYMALLIAPNHDIASPDEEDVKKYDNSNDAFGIIKESCVKIFNGEIVKSAERIILHQNEEDWLEQLVRKYSKWQVDTVVSHLQTDKGIYSIARQLPVERTE